MVYKIEKVVHIDSQLEFIGFGKMILLSEILANKLLNFSQYSISS